MLKIDVITVHFMSSIVALCCLTAAQLTGHNDQTFTGILSGIIAAGAWGGYQRQLQPPFADTAPAK